MSPDLLMDQSLFDNLDLIGLFSDTPYPDRTVAPSQVFTPPTPQDDLTLLFGVYHTCPSVSSTPDEIAHSPELERPEDVEKLPEHRAGFAPLRKIKKVKQMAPTGPRVVPRNAFPCRYENCIGKDHRPKSFQRKYHRDRHEQTVHPNSMHIPHRCWVKGCKSTPFTRADNLKDHLKNVHGKKSWSGKYQYVATQDEFSIHYEP